MHAHAYSGTLLLWNLPKLWITRALKEGSKEVTALKNPWVCSCRTYGVCVTAPRCGSTHNNISLALMRCQSMATHQHRQQARVGLHAVKQGGRRCGHPLLDHMHGIRWWRTDGGMRV